MLEKMKQEIDIVEEKRIRNTGVFIKNAIINPDSYEMKVLLEENIDNIYKFQIVYEDGKEVLFADVSGTISFDEYLKTNKINKSNLCRILIAIDNTLANTENYLISENSLSLDSRGIRILKDGKNINIKFLVIPNLNSDFSYELAKFILKILRYVDVEDREALTLAYSLFVRSSKDNYTLSDLMELVDVVKDKDKNYLLDEKELYEHDMELASEISEEIINDNILDKVIYDEYPNEKESIVEPKSNKKIIYDDSINELCEENEKVLTIDSKTKDILNDNIFESFDDEKKVINFKKPKFNFKLKKVLSGHINLSLLKITIVPIGIIIIPFIVYFIYGISGFKKFMPTIFIYEMAFLMIYMLTLFRNSRKSK